MNRLAINLASRPFRNNIIPWVAAVIAAAAVAFYSWFNAVTIASTEREIASLQASLEEKATAFVEINDEVEQMTQAISGMDLRDLNDRNSFANAVIVSRLFSWTELFDRLETIQPENVRLRSIRPAATRGGIEIAIEAAAKDYGSVLRFEESLLDSEYFSFVYPQQESSRDTQGSEIHFNLTFGYLPEGKEPAAAGVPAGDPEAFEAGEGDEPSGASGTLEDEGSEEDIGPEGADADEEAGEAEEESGAEAPIPPGGGGGR